MQPILENTPLLIGINLKPIKNMMKRAYPLTNLTAFTQPMTFPLIYFNALMSLKDYSLIKIYFITRYARNTTLAYLSYLPF